jgi:hypothetical protein
MSSFLARNKAQASQICEGDTYPTIGAVLTAISMCIIYASYHCLFCCKRCIDSDRNEQLIDSDGFTRHLRGYKRHLRGYTRHLHAFSRTTSKLLFFLVLRSLCMTSDCCRLLCRIVSPAQEMQCL